MKLRACLVLIALGALAASPLKSQQVSNPGDRQKSLMLAEDLLAIRPATLPANATDPFHSVAFAEATGAVRPDESSAGGGHQIHRSDKDLLAAIAATLKPNGFFVLGGEPVLLFGQKRVKAGSPMTINFEGSEYTIEIVAVDRTSFTLRLNREEYTRPIK